jgi:antitoxin PrlF
MRSLVGERGQVTIPKALRKRFGIKPKTVVEFRDEGGRIVIEKVSEGDSVARATGCLHLDQSTDELIDELRDTA